MICKYLCLVVLFCSINNSLLGQTQTIESRNSLYVDFLGAAGTPLSLNYDRILKESVRGYFNLSVGFGYTQLKGFNSPVIGIPLNINYTHGLEKHHLEVGAGLTYNLGMRQFEESASYDNQRSVILDEGNSEVLFLSSRIGYKYQRSKGGVLMRLGFTPLITLYNFSDYKVEEHILPLFDIAIGYAY